MQTPHLENIDTKKRRLDDVEQQECNKEEPHEKYEHMMKDAYPIDFGYTVTKKVDWKRIVPNEAVLNKLLNSTNFEWIGYLLLQWFAFDNLDAHHVSLLILSNVKSEKVLENCACEPVSHEREFRRMIMHLEVDKQFVPYDCLKSYSTFKVACERLKVIFEKDIPFFSVGELQENCFGCAQPIESAFPNSSPVVKVYLGRVLDLVGANRFFPSKYVTEFGKIKWQNITDEAAALLTSMSRLQMVQYFGWRAMRNQTGSWECQVLLDAEFCENKCNASLTADKLIENLIETNEQQSSGEELEQVLEKRIREFEKVLRHHVKYAIPFVCPRGVVVEDYFFRCG